MTPGEIRNHVGLEKARNVKCGATFANVRSRNAERPNICKHRSTSTTKSKERRRKAQQDDRRRERGILLNPKASKDIEKRQTIFQKLNSGKVS